MFRVRKVSDDITPANRNAIVQVEAILREQFPGLPASEIASISDQLRDPVAYRLRSILFVAEDANDQVRGCVLLRHAPDLKFCYLDVMAVRPGRTGGGLGALLYERVREEAVDLDAIGLFFECLPDDPALSPNPEIRAQNIARLRFYERYGARPVANTAYETPLEPGGSDPPYLVVDQLNRPELPARDVVRAIVRAILDRKYGDVCPPGYVETVVESFRDDPIRLRPPRYVRKAAPQAAAVTPKPARKIPLFVNDKHEIHHVRERGYVEAPVRIRSILSELEKSNLFDRQPAHHYGDRHIRAVHDGALVDYVKAVCRTVEPKHSIYPYVFPIRNAVRPPRERAVRAGYYCIDTFTPLNANAYGAARGAVDCALSAAQSVLEGQPFAYALVRPPGHHAERKVFGGFCYFNNAAVAAHYLSRYGRVAVLDIDYHHGNGTQDIFYDRDDVLTISIHGNPRFAYPYFSGFKDETGLGRGAGYNVNYPLAESITPEEHRRVLTRALRRVSRFDPAYLIVAAGFDTAKSDPTGTWSNHAADFEAIGRILGQAGYPTLVVQEGGYRIRTLGVNVRRFFVGLVRGAAEAATKAPTRGPAERPIAKAAVDWREILRPEDAEDVRRMVEETAMFTGEEVDVAVELVTERVTKGPSSGYDFLFAEREGRPAGYACFGPIPGAPGRWDLYWIVVRPDAQRGGIGRELLRRAESLMAQRGAERIYIDTSTAEKYTPTRAFYRAMGYRKVAELPDFYGDANGKAIFAKTMAAGQELSGQGRETVRQGTARPASRGFASH